MALKDGLRNFMAFFEMDDTDVYEEEGSGQEEPTPTMRVANPAPTGPQPAPAPTPVSRPQMGRSRTSESHPVKEQRVNSETRSRNGASPMQGLHQRQRELMTTTDKTTIDIKFPKRYEDAPDIINLLIDNVSVLIDFQYMSEAQARRCLDYLDGARSVLAGNLKKVSATMWLLTPVNVQVNIEDLRLQSASMGESGSYDYDMRR